MAVLVYLGRGVSSTPTQLPDAVVDYFGTERAPGFIERGLALRTESPLTWPDSGDHDIGSATDEVISRLRMNHPELSDDALIALGWDWSWLMWK